MKKKWKNKIRSFLQTRNLQFYISVPFTIIAVVGMLMVGIVLMVSFTSANEKNAADYNQKMLDQVNYNLDSYLRSMMKISDAAYYRIIKSSDLERDSLDHDLNLLYETHIDSLVNIAIFGKEGDLLAAAPASIVKKTVKPSLQDWFLNANLQIENMHFSTPHVQNLFEDKDHNYRWVISLSRSVEITKNGNIESGVLLVDMNFNAIDVMCKNANFSSSGYVYLIDNSGNIIMHPRQQLLYSHLLSENNYLAATYEDGTHTEVFEHHKRMVTVKTVGYTGWKLVAVSPIGDISQTVYSLVMLLILTILFCSIILILVNGFVSSRIANPVRRLENSVKELEAGRENVAIAIGGSNEIRHLGESIRDMVARLHELMQDIIREQESKRKSELDALQGQINPHFLYNTLDSVVWMIENEQIEGATRMITSFANFFRISLSQGRRIIRVEEELSHAQNYMTIQHMRFKDKFDFQTEIQPETLSLKTIKLIVQPILENAIYHGMEYMDGDGLILLKSYLQDGDLWIDVVDNGPGMTPDVVEGLMTRQHKSRGKGSGIGLRNVDERIKLYFGADYGLIILSEPDEGTTVRIHLLAVPYQEHETEVQ